jgi:hypothetical protein
MLLEHHDALHAVQSEVAEFTAKLTPGAEHPGGSRPEIISFFYRGVIV